MTLNFGIEDLNAQEIAEVARVHLDLLRQLNAAVDDSETGYAFVSRSAQGLHLTGHAPIELFEHVYRKGYIDRAVENDYDPGSGIE